MGDEIVNMSYVATRGGEIIAIGDVNQPPKDIAKMLADWAKRGMEINQMPRRAACELMLSQMQTKGG